MAREREAVDSEHELRINNDNIRYLSAINQLAKENHPMRRFNCGNKETLSLKDVSQLTDPISLVIVIFVLF